MLTCNHCGELVHADSENCQNCGMPLLNIGKGEPDPKMDASEQSELPSWLESLRASERHGPASGSAQPAFSKDDLFDEGPLPSWMRPENADNLASGPHPALRPASGPAPNIDAEYSPPRGISASSLIDEQSLPSWIHESGIPSWQSSPRNISASSLVQPDAVPDWMKNSQQFPPSPPVEPIAPMQAMPANDLIDPQALPPWITQPSNPVPQEGQPASYNAPQAGLAGSSLLDMNALPNWLREAEQTQNDPNRGTQGVAPYQNGPINPPISPGQASGGPGNLAAASLIDMNALPGWLRSSGGQQQGFPANPDLSASRPGPFGPPPRPENMRVPNRPRGEIGPQEHSEVAANVFSSMLGVASSAPYYPSQSMNDAFGPAQNPSGANFQGASQFVPPDSQNAPPITMQPGYPGAYSGQGGYPAGNQPNNSSSMPPGPMDRAPAPGGNSSGSKSSSTKPARRSFLDTIREWFSR